MTSSSLSPHLDLKDLFGAPDMSEWMTLTEKVLGGVPFEKKMVSKTLEGIAQQPVYDRSVWESLAMADTTPGEYPYVRGTTAASGVVGRWQVCQDLPYADPAEFNRELLHDLGRGQDSVLLRAEATDITTPENLQTALNGVDLEQIPLHVEAGAAARVVADLLVEAGTVPAAGSICFDPVAELATKGRLPMDLDAAADLLADHVKSTAETLPGMASVGVDVSWNVNAGGNAVYDLALMLASAAQSFRWLTEAGVEIDTAAEKALVRFAVGSDYFMEVAKFRAARALWAHLVKSCGGGEAAQKLTQFATTSSWHQTRLDPWVNLLRGTSQAFSAVMGGMDGLTVLPFDAPFGLPDTFSRRIARNTQLILRDETHLGEVIDPAGGSWTIEQLTGELADKAWSLFQEIEAAGGILAKLTDGSLQSDIAAQGTKQRTLLAQRRTVKVGSNQFAFPEEKKLPERQPEAVALPAIAEGTPVEVTPVTLGRLTEGYEALRDAMEAYTASGKPTPVAFLAQMGPVRQYKIRSDFSQEFLKPSGFDLDASQTFESAEEAAAAVIERGAAVTVICSTDDTYPDLVPVFAKAVKAGSPSTVVLMAGMLPDHLDAFREAGVDDFIHLKANNLELLQSLHRLTGVSA